MMSGFVVRLLVMLGGRTREIVSVSRDRPPGGSVRALGRPVGRPVPDDAAPAGVAGEDTAAALNVRVAEPASPSRVPDPPARAVPDADIGGPDARSRSRPSPRSRSRPSPRSRSRSFRRSRSFPAAVPARPETAERPAEPGRCGSADVSVAVDSLVVAEDFAAVDAPVESEAAADEAVDDRDPEPVADGVAS
ncbi:hypothetical protein FRACA_70031 [Frankia canadensis]|uniref:Uncharacterized protein n=1 Tax=Frankia canadensis TaxID=1836972 RepID=A0A2I2L0H5_9ACTN|nr:hypothetical protein FRACA_70031 [Frankia canadensis]SOU58705.1 hypothetical protein FRACA_70031 [Frankia canadensis]